MEKEQLVEKLILMLVKNLRSSVQNQVNDFAKDYQVQRALLRGLMNMHPVSQELPLEFFTYQDELLQLELKEKKLASFENFYQSSLNENVYLYEGDICAIKADAIVNSANETLLGCFQAGHNCTDNCIHSASGLQLRFECAKLVRDLKVPITPGTTIITHGFNLPNKYVIHTVAPKIFYDLKDDAKAELKLCYEHSLNIARNNQVKTLAISFVGSEQHGIPLVKCAKVATDVVYENLKEHHNDLKVVLLSENERQTNALKTYFVHQDDNKNKDLHPFFNVDLM